MSLKPLYSQDTLRAAYQLRYSWTGWFKSEFKKQPDSIFDAVDSLWEQDGLRRLEHAWTEDRIQITFSAKPSVSPVYLATRAKGRLQYLLRNQPSEFPGFTRKVSVRSIGENTSRDIAAYIASQVDKQAFVDPRFAEQLSEFTRRFPEVDLAAPTESARGRYWYNLHIVLVVACRGRIRDLGQLRTLFERSLRIAERKGHRIASISVMPDHLHMALRGDVERSPVEIALDFLNNLAYALGQSRVWQDGFYAGTFSEYDMNAIRHRAAHEQGRRTT